MKTALADGRALPVRSPERHHVRRHRPRHRQAGARPAARACTTSRSSRAPSRPNTANCIAGKRTRSFTVPGSRFSVRVLAFAEASPSSPECFGVSGRFGSWFRVRGSGFGVRAVRRCDAHAPDVRCEALPATADTPCSPVTSWRAASASRLCCGACLLGDVTLVDSISQMVLRLHQGRTREHEKSRKVRRIEPPESFRDVAGRPATASSIWRRLDQSVDQGPWAQSR